jgi:type IV secretion system protein VirB5
MKQLIRKGFAALTLTAAVGSANAGVPVIDVANLAQAIQQVLAWAQQYQQMVDQIQEARNQVSQLQTTYNSMTGTRGLGTILNGAVDQAARRYLPSGGSDIEQLAGGVVTGYAPLQSTIAGFKSQVSSMPAGTFGSGTDAANALTAKINSLATQKALGEATYTSAAQRTADLENLIATIGVASDPKAIAEIHARIGAQQALVANENAKLQSMAYMQVFEQQQSEQRANEVVANWGKAPLTAIAY